jgi:hypothetical protein
MTGIFYQSGTASERCASEFFLADIKPLNSDIERVNKIIESFDVEI